MADADSMPVSRACTKCSETKPLEDFCKAAGGKYGLSSRCRACAALYAHANQEKISALSLARYHRLNEPKRLEKEQARLSLLSAPEKTCSRCGLQQTKDQFKKQKTSADGLHGYCRTCCNELNRQYRQQNPDKAAAWTAKWLASNRERKNAYTKQWAKENADRMLFLTAQWRAANLDKVRQTGRDCTRRRRLDAAVRIHDAIGNGLRFCLSGGKKSKTFDLLGYSVAELMDHLEKQFLKGMTWGNYGSWHVDHIQPLSSFFIQDESDPQLRIAWGLPNLRPLWAVDNQRKHAKRLYLV